MTADELLHALVSEAIKENQYQADRSSNEFYKEAYQNIADYLSQHPLMQEGKEYCDGVYEVPAPSLLPVNDEQPENKGMPLFLTPYSKTDIKPRSKPSDDLDVHSMNLV